MCMCVWSIVPYMCAVLGLVLGNMAHCMVVVLKLPCTLTHLCGCGVLNEVSKFIGGCKICTDVRCLALNSHDQCKTFVGHFD